MTDETWIIYTDGACSGNPGPGGWAFILASPNWVWELSGYELETTNNRMEILAVIRALEFFSEKKENSKINIYSDSTYVINGVTQWIWAWKKNQWMTAQKLEVKNKDLWIRLDQLLSGIKNKINWIYVKAHVGIPGNERVDLLAVEAIKQKSSSPLVTLARQDYPLELLNPFESEIQKPTIKKNSSSSKKALGYVTYLGGQVSLFLEWKECSSFVQGRSYVKYKKFYSQEELKEILNSWGVNGEKIKEIIKANKFK